MNRFNNILCATNQTSQADPALARAVSMAESNQASLTLMDVVPPLRAGVITPPEGTAITKLQKQVVDRRKEELTAMLTSGSTAFPVTVEVAVGKTYLEIIRQVLRRQYDLVIKSAENPSWIDRLLGSDDLHLLRKCPCPLWLTKPAEQPRYRKILAAVDIDPHDTRHREDPLNQQILEMASSLALSDLSALHLVHAWDAPEAGFVGLWADDPKAAENSIIEGEYLRHKDGMDRLSQNLRQHLGGESYDYLSPRTHLIRDTAARAIPALAEQLKADLVVMGTLARTGIAGLIIGNTAEAILQQLRCSVLAVKPPGFVSPVTLSD